MNSGGHITIGIVNKIVNQAYIRTNSIITAGQWYHLLGTYNGNGLASGFNIYLNGVLQTVSIAVSTLSSMSISTTVPFLIGALHSTDQLVDGNIDEVCVYGSELTASQVLNLYNLGRKDPVIPTTNLVSHWRMDAVNPIDEQGINNGTGVNIDATNIVQFY